ncbi:MAG: hypothetical protein Kow00120_03500 [Anaerolineae bacterium]
MTRFFSGIRRPVKRTEAPRYLILVLVSFAVSVVGTRLFLELTGYPQLGGGTLHIAHVLWGGLLLFVATLVPLTWANRWTYPATAVLSGLGVGLFIDEVGKFITQNNDYFYPFAAPIIYAFFLLTALIYIQVRRLRPSSARYELYSALDGLMEVLDRDLDAEEHAVLESRLRYVADNADHPDQAQLAMALLAFLASDAVRLVPQNPGPLDRWVARVRAYERRLFTRARLRWLLILALGLTGALALSELVTLGVALTTPDIVLSQLAESLVASGLSPSPTYALWSIVRLALEVLADMLLLAGSFYMLRGQEARGVMFGTLGFLMLLTTVNLLVFFFDQFRAVSVTLFQLIALLGLVRYRQRFLAEAGAASIRAGTGVRT